MEKLYHTDCTEILSEIKHQEKLINLKRRWLMGLPTSRSKKKQIKEPKFFKYKALPESFLRADDMFYETINAHVEEAIGASNFERSHVIDDDVQSFDAPKIMRVVFSSLDALTNNGLYQIAMILLEGSGKFEKTRGKMKKVIRESLPRCLSIKNHDHKQKRTISLLYKVLNDSQNFQNNIMKPVTPTFQFDHAAATGVLNGLEDLPLQTLIAMDRKLRCLKRVPQLEVPDRSKKRIRLIKNVGKTAKMMFMDLDKTGKPPEPLAKALTVADLSLKLTTGCQNSSPPSFYEFSPEIVSLQDDIMKAIWILKTKVRFTELKNLKLLLDPDVDIPIRSLRGAVTNMLTGFLFECGDMDPIPKSLLEILPVINKDSRSTLHRRSQKDDIEEEVESILNVSAQFKQIVWDLLPDNELDEEFDDAYGEELEESDDDSCIEDDGSCGADKKIENNENKDLESCMSHSVSLTVRGDGIQYMKVDPVNAMSNEKGSEDIRSMSKLHASSNKNCFSSLSLLSRELNCRSIERGGVEQNNGVDQENQSTFSPDGQLGNGITVHNESSMSRNQYLTIQDACDETSLVAYSLIGRLLEKFAKEQDMDIDSADKLYLRGESSIKVLTQEEKQRLSRKMQEIIS